jgi:ribonucleoside-diphosphate reductase alpha chain
MTDVQRQLGGIGGGRSLGFGPNRVRSLPDGVAQVLQEYLDERAVRMGKGQTVRQVSQQSLLEETEAAQMNLAPEDTDALSNNTNLARIGDLCPECGVAAVINEEGCRKCYSCGYSEC